MPPKLVSDSGKQIVIRPLVYCKEKEIEKYAIAKDFPIIPLTIYVDTARIYNINVKEMLPKWDRQYPGRIETMFQCITKCVPSHLCSTTVVDFKSEFERSNDGWY